SGTGTNQNVVAGNLIGTNAVGTGALGNQSNGIGIQGGAQSNRIGTDGNNNGFDGHERNIIAASGAAGGIINNRGTNLTMVAGNWVGIDANGRAFPRGAVSWWKAEGNGSTTAADSIDGNPGTLTGGVTYRTGEVGQAFNFDGTSGYVRVSTAANLQPTVVSAE